MPTIFYVITLLQFFAYKSKTWSQYSPVFDYVDTELFDAIVNNVLKANYPDFYETVKTFKPKDVKLNFYRIACYIKHYKTKSSRPIKLALGFLYENSSLNNLPINTFYLTEDAEQ